MLKSIVMHQLDFNYIAACEEWYYKCHGPQIARRYGPWLARFESFRPIPLPADINSDKLGYTNWLTTIGYWFDIPEEGPRGELSMTSPVKDARNFSTFLPPQYMDDFKGYEVTPEEKACLRLLQFWKYPDNVNVEDADRWFTDTLSKEVVNVPSVYRFFGVRTIPEEIHLPGTWKPETMAEMIKNGSPEDHRWDRVTEMWFETFDDIREFLEASKTFSKPDWAQTDEYPYLNPYSNLISTVLLDRPAYDWKKDWCVYR